MTLPHGVPGVNIGRMMTVTYGQPVVSEMVTMVTVVTMVTCLERSPRKKIQFPTQTENLPDGRQTFFKSLTNSLSFSTTPLPCQLS